METLELQEVRPVQTKDWTAFYKKLQQEAAIPGASHAEITGSYAVFRGAHINLAEVKELLRKSAKQPLLTTVYTDVLTVPAMTNWLVDAEGLVIFARHVVVQGEAKVLMNYQEGKSAQFVLFAGELEGSLIVSAISSNKDQPVTFDLGKEKNSAGIAVRSSNGKPVCMSLDFIQGLGLQQGRDFLDYLNTSFLFASVLYDKEPELSISLLNWVKNWAAQRPETEDLFYRSASLATLLNCQMNAARNGNRFVPYLTAEVYADLAKAYVAEALNYENKYLQLSTVQELTAGNIATIGTMIDNTQSEENYVNALLQQAKDNYNNAIAAAEIAHGNFSRQDMALKMIKADFEQIGIPDYERQEIIKAIVGVLTAVVTFGAAIGGMVMGNEAAAPAAAEGAISGANAIAKAAETAKDVAETAKKTSDSMKQLKKLVEVLKKVYELAKAVKEVADNLKDAKGQMKVIQDMTDATTGLDLNVSVGWAVYKVQADNILEGPVDKEIGYAKEYKEAFDILVIYGQALAAAQLAVIQTGQEMSAMIFRKHYVEEKKANLRKLVSGLKEKENISLQLMQQLYGKYVDSKSSLFSTLKSYQASYFYWALRESSVRPVIIDPVSKLNSGIEDLRKISFDKLPALETFNPAPQEMKNIQVEIDQRDNKYKDLFAGLQKTGKASFALPLENEEFLGLERIRLDTVRVWLEGTSGKQENYHVMVSIETSGNYFDRFKKSFQFSSKPLKRAFEYRVTKKDDNKAWTFDNGTFGRIELDGRIDEEVKYAYFRPTPFTEWKITVDAAKNPGLDVSKVNKLTICFEGTAIAATDEALAKLVR